MISEKQREKARLFSLMHKEKKMFVLPNAWSAGSGYVFQQQGFKAVATSSAGIAYDLGYPDGEKVSFDDLLNVVGQMVRRLDVAISVDFERGYAEKAAEIKENARRLILAGAVGLNIEDGLPDGTLSPLKESVEKINALSQLKRELDIEFVINGRTCAYWLDVAGEEEKLKIAIERGNAFAAAGADCVFIPGAMDELTVSNLVKGIDAPVNIILNGKYNDFAGLEKLGVSRLSVGSGMARYVYGQLVTATEELTEGNVSAILENQFTYGKANAYFDK